MPLGPTTPISSPGANLRLKGPRNAALSSTKAGELGQAQTSGKRAFSHLDPLSSVKLVEEEGAPSSAVISRPAPPGARPRGHGIGGHGQGGSAEGREEQDSAVADAAGQARQMGHQNAHETDPPAVATATPTRAAQIRNSWRRSL